MGVAAGVERVGIVVGRLDQGEFDRIVRVLTPDAGSVSAWARGARRAGSPFVVLDIGAKVRVGLRTTRGELLALTGAEVEDSRLHIRDSFVRSAMAAYACELCAALSGRDHADPKLFGLLDMALLLLDAATSDPGSAFQVGLEAKALTYAGVAPVFDRCLCCRRPVDEEMCFVPDAGGLHHRDDVPGEATGVVVVSRAFLAEVEAARRRPLRESLDQVLGEGPDLLGAVLASHLRRVLPSRTVLRALLRVG